MAQHALAVRDVVLNNSSAGQEVPQLSNELAFSHLVPPSDVCLPPRTRRRKGTPRQTGDHGGAPQIRWHVHGRGREALEGVGRREREVHLEHGAVPGGGGICPRSRARPHEGENPYIFCKSGNQLEIDDFSFLPGNMKHPFIIEDVVKVIGISDF